VTHLQALYAVCHYKVHPTPLACDTHSYHLTYVTKKRP